MKKIKIGASIWDITQCLRPTHASTCTEHLCDFCFGILPLLERVGWHVRILQGKGVKLIFICASSVTCLEISDDILSVRPSVLSTAKPYNRFLHYF